MYIKIPKETFPLVWFLREDLLSFCHVESGKESLWSTVVPC